MKIDFGSTRLAFFLIALLVILILLSAIIPQKEIAVGQIVDFKEKLGDTYIVIEIFKLDEIYTAPYFFILLGLLTVNLITGNIKRFKIIYKTEKTLIKARHIGSIIFHFSLILILSGAILNYLYRFEGVFSITEGQKVYDNESEYFRIFKGPLYNDDYGDFYLTLDKFIPNYKIHDDYTDAASIIISTDSLNDTVNTIIHHSNPYTWSDKEIHFGSKSGYSPEILLTDTSGVELFRSFVRVSHQTDKNQNRHYDYIIIPQYDLKIEIEILADSTSIESTLFNIIVEKSNKLLYEDKIRLNESANVDDFILRIPRLRHWCYINVIRNPYLVLIFLGFWSTLGGLVINLIPRIVNESKKL